MYSLPDLSAMQSSPKEKCAPASRMPSQLSGSKPSVFGLFAGALTRMFRKRKSLEKYGCKFHDGEFWNVTPCTVTFLQWLRKSIRGRHAPRRTLQFCHQSPFSPCPSSTPSPYSTTSSTSIPLINAAYMSSGLPSHEPRFKSSVSSVDRIIPGRIGNLLRSVSSSSVAPRRSSMRTWLFSISGST